MLDDLADLFATVRTWAGVIEKRPGVFHVRRQSFLHFQPRLRGPVLTPPQSAGSYIASNEGRVIA